MNKVGLAIALLGAAALAACGSSSSTKTASPLAGNWELDIVTDSEPHLVLQVANDNTAKLLSAVGFANKQYASITFVETKDGINVLVEEVQQCGNRKVTYTTVKTGNDYVGSVSGPNADCKAGNFQSPAKAVKLVRQS